MGLGCMARQLCIYQFTVCFFIRRLFTLIVPRIYTYINTYRTSNIYTCHIKPVSFLSPRPGTEFRTGLLD